MIMRTQIGSPMSSATSANNHSEIGESRVSTAASTSTAPDCSARAARLFGVSVEELLPGGTTGGTRE